MPSGPSERGPGGRGIHRAGRDDRRMSGGQVAAEPPGGLELEEMPVQRVVVGRRGRPPIGAALAATGLVALLAVGFGAFGGHDRPVQTQAALAPVPLPTLGPSAAVATPLVTPASACGSDPAEVPVVILQVGGIQTLGDVTVVRSSQGQASAPSPRGSGIGRRIDVRSDLPSVLYTVGDRCAVAWQLLLTDSSVYSQVIAGVNNPTGDPGIASQNRFELPLWKYHAGDYALSAVLTYPRSKIRATWPIRIRAVELPTARLSGAKGPLPLGLGCDLSLTLGNGGSPPLDICPEGGVVDVPPNAVAVKAAGAHLRFEFGGGWMVLATQVSCGDLTERAYLITESCGIDGAGTGPSLGIVGPSKPGTWTMQIAACAVQELPDAYNKLCGSWYASVKVVG